MSHTYSVRKLEHMLDSLGRRLESIRGARTETESVENLLNEQDDVDLQALVTDLHNSFPRADSSQDYSEQMHRDKDYVPNPSRNMTLPVTSGALNPFPELVASPVLPSSVYISMGGTPPSPRRSPLSSKTQSPNNSRTQSRAQSPLVEAQSTTQFPSVSNSQSQSSSRSDSPVQKSENEVEYRSFSHLFRQGRDRLEPERKVLLNIFNDDSTYKTVPVKELTTAQDLCHLLTVKNHTVEDKNWTIVEMNTHLHIERGLEDHESVVAVHDSWKNEEHHKLFFRKDFRKYDIFLNPTQYYSPHFKDSNEELSMLCEKAERQKKLLLQNLFNESDRIPDMDGFLHMKESGKKSWKKAFFVLRGSGLYYSTKGTSKDPRHLVVFCQLKDSPYNIYTAIGAKKTFHAPHEFVFCLKSTVQDASEPKELKCLCADDEKSRVKWMAGLRLVKYGSKLRDNYQTALRREERLRNADNGGLMSPHESDAKCRVAMDFTGREGRVVDDPNEAIGVAIEEGQHWRRKVRGTSSPMFSHSPKSHPDIIPMMESSPTQAVTMATSPGRKNDALFKMAHSATRPSHGLASGIHMSQPWFHSGVSREEACELILKNGLVDGVWLIRESHNIPGVYILSFAHNQKIKHFQINPIESEGHTYYSLDGATKFADLLQLVEFYQVNPAGLPTKLMHHVTKL